MADNIQKPSLVVLALFPALSTLVVILRFYSRYLIRQFGWDDALIIIAWLLAVGQAAADWMFTKTTWQGYHVWDIPEQSIEEKTIGLKYNIANQLLYNPILAIVKASVIIFLFRLEDRRPVVLWNLRILFCVNIALMIAIFLADLFQCTPMHYFYDGPAMDLAAQKAAGADENGMKDGKLVKGGTCISQIRFFLISAAFTIITDIWLLCIPSIIVWRLQMNRTRKIAIIAVLSMGVIVTLVGIARLAVYAHRFRPNNPDPTYDIGHITSSIEVNVAIMAASATAFPALISRIAPRIWSSIDRTKERRRRTVPGTSWTITGGSGSGTGNGTRRGRDRASYVMMGNIKTNDGTETSQERIITETHSAVSPKDGV